MKRKRSRDQQSGNAKKGGQGNKTSVCIPKMWEATFFFKVVPQPSTAHPGRKRSTKKKKNEEGAPSTRKKEIRVHVGRRRRRIKRRREARQRR